MSARYFAATSSLPGGFVVLMRMNPCSHPIASISICDRLGCAAAGACAPGPYGGAGVDWARAGTTHANIIMNGKTIRLANRLAHTDGRAGTRERAILRFPQSLKFIRRVPERYYHVSARRPDARAAGVSQSQSVPHARPGRV